MSSPHPELDALRRAIRAFAEARDWQPFHTPKNLAMALLVEAAELAEPFQWLTPEQSQSLDEATKAAVAEEIADVAIYLLRLADVLGIDPWASAWAKLEKNARKYPAEKCRGSARKSDEPDSPV